MKRKKYPSYNRKYKRRKKTFYKKRWFWDFVLILLFSLSISWLLFKTPYFQIKEVKITGETKLSDSIQDIIGQNLNFFLLNKSSLSQRIQESFPKIGDVEIQREFPNKILISLVEKKEVAIICSQEKSSNCFSLASDGTVFERAEKEKNLPEFLISTKKEIKVGKLVVEKKIMENFVFLQDELKKFKILIGRVHVLPFELKVETKNGFKIYFSKDDNLKMQVEILIKAFQETISKNEQKKLQYIDLRGIRKDGKGEVYFK